MLNCVWLRFYFTLHLVSFTFCGFSNYLNTLSRRVSLSRFLVLCPTTSNNPPLPTLPYSLHTMPTDKTFTFVPLGAILKDFKVSSQNLVLNFSDPKEYIHNPCYFGATIGRVANRIADASFTLNGTKYQLARNNEPCALHGGIVGWDRREWVHVSSEAVELSGGKVGGWRDVFSLTSEDGEEGYPGRVKCVLKYTQWREKWVGAVGGERDVLEMEFEAGLVEEKGEESVEETVMNLTNHT